MMASFAAESTTIVAMSGLSGSFSPMSSKFWAALGYVPIFSVTVSFWSVMIELSLLPVAGSSNHTLLSSPVTFTMNSEETDVDLSVALMTVRPVMSRPLAPMPSVLSSSDMLEPVFVISWNTSWSYSQFTSASTVSPAFVVALAETVMKSSSSMSIDAELPESVIDVTLFCPNMSREHESSMDTASMIAMIGISLFFTSITSLFPVLSCLWPCRSGD